jgi:uncharacterized HAD superfamily protein
MKTLGIDLDGVVCSEEKTFDRPLARVLPGAVEFIKTARQNGNLVVIWTARGWEQYKMTVDWLQKNDIEFDQLVMGKPIFDVYIDDRAIGHENWLNTQAQLALKGFDFCKS